MDDLEDYRTYEEPIRDMTLILKEENMDQQLTKLAISNRPLKIPSKGATREDIRNAINTAFELIGGIPRLAIWANDNPEKFYALWSKTNSVQAQNVSGKLIVEHVLKRSKLDEVTITPDGKVVDGDDSFDPV